MEKYLFNNVHEIKEVLENIPYYIEGMRDTIYPRVFWDFEMDYANRIVGKDELPVKKEAKAFLEMCSEVVVRYQILYNDLERPTFRSVEKMAFGNSFESDCERFVESVQRAEMKALWMNKICKQITGEYFFRGQLEKVGAKFKLESMFALAYLCFLLIDQKHAEYNI